MHAVRKVGHLIGFHSERHSLAKIWINLSYPLPYDTFVEFREVWSTGGYRERNNVHQNKRRLNITDHKVLINGINVNVVL
jgi:hypothetical protein